MNEVREMRNVAVFCLLASIAIFSPAQTNTKPNHEAHLQSLDWLTHGTWTAEAKGHDGKSLLIQSHIRWAETGTAIYFLTRFNGRPHYFGVYLYDPEAKQIKFFYTEDDGEYTAGSAEMSESELKQDFRVSDEKGTTSYSSVIRREGEDAYDFRVYQPGKSEPLIALKYSRK